MIASRESVLEMHRPDLELLVELADEFEKGQLGLATALVVRDARRSGVRAAVDMVAVVSSCVHQAKAARPNFVDSIGTGEAGWLAFRALFERANHEPTGALSALRQLVGEAEASRVLDAAVGVADQWRAIVADNPMYWAAPADQPPVSGAAAEG